ncbi:MAG: dTMP kinase [Pseudomonadales bacterium]|nr:dTMP kinase [Pseudomonadales bacterium]
MTNSSVKFITIEGMEGAGKSTNLSYVIDFFQQRGIDFAATREPGGTEISEKIRHLLLEHHTETLAPLAELMLIFAARAQHIDKVIKPALDAGQWVICDRFTDATYAYQGEGRQLGGKKVELLERFVQQELQPDLTIILDVPVALSAARVEQRGGELDRFEVEDSDFFQRVRDAYHQRADAVPERYALIDASQPLLKVQAELLGILERLLD